MTLRTIPYRSLTRLGAWSGALAFLVLLGGCQPRGVWGAGVKGSGVVKTEKRAIAGFSRVDVGGPVTLEWQPNKEPSLEVTLEDNLLPLLATEIEGDTLKIYFKESVNATKDILVKASSPSLDGFQGGGATQATLKEVQSDQFNLGLSGASRCTISGKAKALTIECAGASDLKADGLDTVSATVEISGASTAEVRAKQLRSVELAGAAKATIARVDTDAIKIELSGASRCTLTGRADKLTADVAGASNLDATALKVKTAQVDVAGASSVELEASERIAGTATGASRIRYKGDAVNQVQTSSGASISRP